MQLWAAGGSRNLGLSTFRIGVVYDVLHKYASHMAYICAIRRRPHLATDTETFSLTHCHRCRLPLHGVVPL